MTVSNPIAWFLLLLAIPVVLLYLLRVRHRREAVATLMFWRQVFEERRFRAFWRRFRTFASLLLSLLFLALLTAALLAPVFDTENVPEKLAIIVDNSASMKALSGTETRLDLTKDELRRLLSKGAPARRTVLSTSGGRPEIVAGLTDHVGTLRDGVEAIRSTDAPSALIETVAPARRIADSILILTDGCDEHLAALAGEPGIRIRRFGEPIDNIGITQFQARRTADDPTGYEIFVEAANFGRKPIEARLEIELEDRIADVVPWTLSPGEKRARTVHGSSRQGGLIRATLKPDDLFATDNTAIAFLNERRRLSVSFYGENDFFVQKVLKSQPNVDLRILGDLSETAGPDGIRVFHRELPTAFSGESILIVDPRNGCDLFGLGEPLENPVVSEQKDDSPFLRFVRLKNVPLPGARELKPKGDESFEILASAEDGFPLLLHWPERNVFVLTADLNRGDLAFRTAFPILISNILNEFGDIGGEMEYARSAGDETKIFVRTQDDSVILHSPSGEKRTYSVQSGIVSTEPLDECGIWEIFEPDSKKRLARIACNLSNEKESDLRTATKIPDEATVLPISNGRPIVFAFVLAALLLAVCDWTLYQRRWIE